jgi:hypothetical protein
MFRPHFLRTTIAGTRTASQHASVSMRKTMHAVSQANDVVYAKAKARPETTNVAYSVPRGSRHAKYQTKDITVRSIRARCDQIGYPSPRQTIRIYNRTHAMDCCRSAKRPRAPFEVSWYEAVISGSRPQDGRKSATIHCSVGLSAPTHVSAQIARDIGSHVGLAGVMESNATPVRSVRGGIVLGTPPYSQRSHTHGRIPPTC